MLLDTPLRGNVETEIAGDDDRNGCGCGYPESVPDADVERSNASCRGCGGWRAPMITGHRAAHATRCAANASGGAGGETRIGIVHGDARASPAGALLTIRCDDARRLEPIAALFDDAEVDGFASTQHVFRR